MTRRRPSLFVGSSSEGHEVAQAVQVLLDPKCEVEIWSQGLFGLSQGTLESLVLALDKFDFAVLVLTSDDLVTKRSKQAPSPRDNVVFELGLFVGGLGRDRTFMVYDRSTPLELPSDLAGITAATFEPHSSGNLQAALGASCTKIENAVDRLGARDPERFRLLSEATTSFEGASATMQSLVRLLAKSRKVELDIISEQFGPVIAPERLQEIQRDLRSLEAVLAGARPVVTATVETVVGGNRAIAYNLVVKNTGGAPAFEVQLSAIEDDIRRCLTNDADATLVDQVLRCFGDAGRIPVLRNGEDKTNSFGLTSRQTDSTWQYGASFPITIQYRGEDGKDYTTPMDVTIKDSEGFAGGTWKRTP